MKQSILSLFVVGIGLLGSMAVYAGPTCHTGAWCLNGNAGTNAPGDFIGTTDTAKLMFKVNNIPMMQMIPNSNMSPVTNIYGSLAVGAGMTVTSPRSVLEVGGGVLFGSQLSIGQNSAMSSILGGTLNNMNGSDSTIAGGNSNKIYGDAAFIGGGKANTVKGNVGFIGGGKSNTINGTAATIPGGYQNFATGYAFAAGMYARAQHNNSFVWNDGTVNPFVTTNINQFLINASKGVGINTNDTSSATLTVNGSIKGKYKAANGAVGISQTVNLKNTSGNACTMTITNGIITATTC